MISLERLEPRQLLATCAVASAPGALASPAPLHALPAVVRPATKLTPATDLSNSLTGTISDGKLSCPYRLFLPTPIPATNALPLIVYLHGLGDGGTDNVGQTYWMSTLRANTSSGQYAAYILAMQLPQGMQWYSTVKQGSEPEKLQMLLIRQILKYQPGIDPTRIYLTGPSAGALGVWDLLQRNNKFFAAGVPMSGALGPSIAPRLKNTPIWAFHGAADTGVSPAFTKALIDAIIKAGGTPWYTEIPGGGHFI